MDKKEYDQMPLNHQYVKRCGMKVIGNIYDNPELLGGTK